MEALVLVEAADCPPVHDAAADEGEGEEGGAAVLEHLHPAVGVDQTDGDQARHGAEQGDAQ